MEKHNLSTNEENFQDLKFQKIYLHLIKPELLPVGYDYLNIDHLDNINDNSLEEIVLNDLLDFFIYSDTTILIDKIISKLKVGGKVSIQSIDLYHLARSITFEDIDLDTVKMILYPTRKSIYTIYDMQTEFKNRQLDIIDKKYINIFEYYIAAQKI